MLIRTLCLALCLGIKSFAQAPDITLDSGHRGLLFTQIDDGPNYTVAFACDLNPSFNPIDRSYIESPKIPIILKETLSLEYRKSLPSNYFSGWDSWRLSSFGPNKAFAYDDLFSIEDGHIRIYPGQAQSEARKIYGLSKTQAFLGAFDNRFYWWVKDKPREIFFRSNNHTFKFTLHKRVTEPLGMSNGDPKGDLSLDAVVIPKGWYPAPRTFEGIVLNFTDAKQVD